MYEQNKEQDIKKTYKEIFQTLKIRITIESLILQLLLIIYDLVSFSEAKGFIYLNVTFHIRTIRVRNVVK